MDVSPVDMGYVGTGPFKFHAYEKGVAVEVRRFDQYWDADEKGNQLPYLDGVDYLIIKEPAAFHAAFRSGAAGRRRPCPRFLRAARYGPLL